MDLRQKEEASHGIEMLHTLREEIVPRISRPIEYPEPSLRLDLQSRSDDEMRMVKHLQQSCLFHSLALHAANEIKLVYLIDGYLTMHLSANPIGLYSFARAMLEFAAFVHETRRRLIEVRERDELHWRPRGEEFFSLLIRARFGTSNPHHAELLVREGASKANVKVFHVEKSVESLAAVQGFETVHSEYAKLCDFVRHNLSSHTIAWAGLRQGTVAHSSGGGEIHLAAPGPILCYQYPSAANAQLAANETAPMAAKLSKATVEWVNDSPEIPYTPQELLRMTGSHFGVARPKPSIHTATSASARRVGRNELCPCGSGEKFKHCCLRPS